MYMNLCLKSIFLFFLVQFDAYIKHGLVICPSDTNSVSFNNVYIIYAYHNHNYPNNSDTTIEYCEIYIIENTTYIAVYSLINGTAKTYLGAAIDIFYI